MDHLRFESRKGGALLRSRSAPISFRATGWLRGLTTAGKPCSRSRSWTPRGWSSMASCTSGS